MLRKVFLLQGLDHLGSVFVPPGVMMTSVMEPSWGTGAATEIHLDDIWAVTDTDVI